jgi:formylglycine-generating enzyme required for sulfatase activity
MKNLLFFLFPVIMFGCSNAEYENFVFVKGGMSGNEKSNLYGSGITVRDFYISKYEVSQKEWKEIMGNNPSKFIGDSLPVEMVTWYDCIDYCNRKSQREHLKPYYNIIKDIKDTNNVCEFDSLKWTITINPGADGYRLPAEAEWEYAAGGGNKSKGFTYSGSNDINKVAWYWKNSGTDELSDTWNWKTLENNNNQTKPVGLKLPNELGLYDMSGNVREWCEDWYVDSETKVGFTRSQRGGGWMGSEIRCETANRDNFESTGKGADQGFRICKSK